VIVTLVVQLVRESLAAGELVGQVEIVETGERVTVRTVDDLVRAARSSIGADEAEDSRRRAR
jgi:hypothetical protein